MPTRERRAKQLGMSIDQLPADRRGKHGNHVKGADASRWSEDRMLSEHGYVKLRVGVEHPLADPNGYAYEHLVVWVSAGREPPAPGFLLHHKNEVKTDNRIENLEFLTKREHAAAHGQLKLTDESVVSIREQFASGKKSQQQLADEFGVAFQRISKVVRGEIWKSAGGPISNIDSRSRDRTSGRFARRGGSK